MRPLQLAVGMAPPPENRRSGTRSLASAFHAEAFRKVLRATEALRMKFCTTSEFLWHQVRRKTTSILTISDLRSKLANNQASGTNHGINTVIRLRFSCFCTRGLISRLFLLDCFATSFHYGIVSSRTKGEYCSFGETDTSTKEAFGVHARWQTDVCLDFPTEGTT